MLPYYQAEDDVVKGKPVKKCSKCENGISPDNYIKNKTICRKRHNENMRKRRYMGS